MPPAGYLTVDGINACLHFLTSTYPSICQPITLPEASHEGRVISAVKLASAAGANRRGVLLIGGVHAREIVNPDMLLALALNLCRAYTSGTGLSYGPKAFSAATIRSLIDRLDIFILPLVNPDGRAYVQSPTGDAFWRKNRSPNPGQPCRGVDINRNYDFLWPSGIGTSANSCSEVFKGANAFSEPETRNVRYLLDQYAGIMGMVDVHSYSQLILSPWGDDLNQSADPSMNFRNPAYNGMRGTVGDSYSEYIPAADANWFTTTGIRIRDAIAAVRGRMYTVEQGVLLYPTTGTSNDYAYSRHFVNASYRKVWAFVVETGLEFQPPYSEALNIISEVSAGLIEFCRVLVPVKPKEKEKDKESKDRKDIKDRKETSKEKEVAKDIETPMVPTPAGGFASADAGLRQQIEQLAMRIQWLEERLAQGQAFISAEDRPHVGGGVIGQSAEAQALQADEEEWTDEQ
jgi:murein tripeptide amidase MpaA